MSTHNIYPLAFKNCFNGFSSHYLHVMGDIISRLVETSSIFSSLIIGTHELYRPHSFASDTLVGNEIQ